MKGEKEMTSDEREDLKGELQILLTDLGFFADEVKEGKYGDMSTVVRQMSDVRREQMNLDDVMIDHELDLAFRDLARAFNDVETERRRFEDEERRHVSKNRDLSETLDGLKKVLDATWRKI